MHEKREREQERINKENKQIAMRVISQESTLNNKPDEWSTVKESPKRINEKTFY
jgi:hypothetical protein